MGALGSHALFPSAITYEPKINSGTVQGERTKDGVKQKNGTAEGGVDTIGESQLGSGTAVNGAARLVRRPVQVQVPS